MTSFNAHRISKYDSVILLPILGLAFYIAFIPHINYPYPVHIDEWVHLALQEAIMKTGNLAVADPWYGREIMGFGTTFESGYSLFWGIFQRLSGIPWMIIYRYFPSIVFMLTALSAYVLGRRLGFGGEAAFFTSLIPTTVGIMGPAFLVPVAMGLLFIPLSIFVAFNFRSVWSYIVLFILTSALLTIHAATALGLVIILAPYVLLNLRSDFRHSLGMALALGIPCLAPFLRLSGALLNILEPLIASQPIATFIQIPHLEQTFGYLPIAFSILGTFVLAIRGGKKSYGLVLGLVALLVMLAAFFTFKRGIPTMYYRGLMWVMLMMGVVAGAGLMWVEKLRLPPSLIAQLRLPAFTRNVGYLLGVVLVGVTLAIGIPDHREISYYHMIDSEDYEAFVWVRDNVDARYSKAILDPWKATAFTAITGKKVYTRIHLQPYAVDEEAYRFLQGGAKDTAFLREKGISIVYTQSGSKNPDLVEVRKNVYLLREAPRKE